MEVSRWTTVCFLTPRLLLLGVAAVLTLLRRTQGLPTSQRVGAMAALACGSICSLLPSRQTVAVAAAGFGGFLICGAISAGICIALVLWYASALPPEENVV